MPTQIGFIHEYTRASDSDGIIIVPLSLSAISFKYRTANNYKNGKHAPKERDRWDCDF